MSNNIEGKVVVITGASSGLGEAAASFSVRTAQTLCWALVAWIACSYWSNS